jgi:hypothetical protein
MKIQNARLLCPPVVSTVVHLYSAVLEDLYLSARNWHLAVENLKFLELYVLDFWE